MKGCERLEFHTKLQKVVEHCSTLWKVMEVSSLQNHTFQNLMEGYGWLKVAKGY